MNQNWSMSEERSFMENLLNQRFNFFVVFYSAIIASFLTISNPFHRLLVLSIGLVILILMSKTIRRSQDKLDEILKILYADPNHPAAIINSAVGNSGSKRKLVGITIPLICIWSLVTLAFIQLISFTNALVSSYSIRIDIGLIFTVLSWLITLIVSLIGKKVSGKWITMVNLALVGFSMGMLVAYIFFVK